VVDLARPVVQQGGGGTHQVGAPALGSVRFWFGSGLVGTRAVCGYLYCDAARACVMPAKQMTPKPPKPKPFRRPPPAPHQHPHLSFSQSASTPKKLMACAVFPRPISSAKMAPPTCGWHWMMMRVRVKTVRALEGGSGWACWVARWSTQRVKAGAQRAATPLQTSDLATPGKNQTPPQPPVTRTRPHAPSEPTRPPTDGPSADTAAVGS